MAAAAVRADLSFLLLLLALLSFLLLLLLVPSSASWDLVILHTNDVHARVEETNAHSVKCGGGGACFAGVARRAALVRKIRAEEPHVLLLDAGDQFQGSAWFNYYNGSEAAHFMNTLKYDAMAFGNHEFDNGVEGLMKPFLEKIEFPVVCSNIKTDETLASTFGKSFLPFKILNVSGEQVGIVGYTSRETPFLSRPGPHLSFEDEVSAVRLQVEKLQAMGVNKILALGHSGFTVDQEVAKRVSGVDVVIGGHSNTFLYNGPAPSSERPVGSYPFVVAAAGGRGVPVVQAYAFGKYLGFLRVSFSHAGDLLKATGNPILLDSSIPQDPEVLAEVNEWKKNLSSYSAEVIGRTLVFLDGSAEECRFRECNLGNLICDAMVDNTMRSPAGGRWNAVTAAIFNGGGIRASIDEQSRDGLITMEDLVSVLPFGGTFDVLQLRGSTLRKTFEHSVRKYGEKTGEFLQVAGLRVELDVSAAAGGRLRSLSVLCSRCRVPGFVPVQAEEIYSVVLPSFLTTGGDGFTMIPQEKITHYTGDLDIAVVSNYIKQKKKVYPSVEGRIKIYSSAAPPLFSLFSLFSVFSLIWSL